MDDHEPQQAHLANTWQAEIEDGVNSVDGNPEDREIEVEGVPGNSQGNVEHDHGYQCYSVRCTKRRLQLEKENKKLGNKVQYLQRKLRDLQEKEPHEKQTERTWPEKLGVVEYKEIYKLSCLEENSNPRTIHPALEFKKRSRARLDCEARKFIEKERQGTKNAEVLKDLVLNPLKPRLFLEYRMKYSFHDLPGCAQERIFQFLFWYPNRLIHAISRLDPFLEPEGVPPIGGKRSGLLNRFHITGMQYGHRCNLTYALKGNDLLAPFLVSRQFLFLGAHAFYGRNTFAFSSLGKFGRFTQGIGPARTQRLQHIELLWIGAQLVTMEGHSRRTWALASLCEMPRLKSLTVYLNESHFRRKHEGIVQTAYLAKKTSGKPSFRMNRDLRTVQGMDYVRQLRGLRVLKVLGHKTRDPVRDWSFVLDLETTCKRDKPYSQHLKSKLENLLPLTERFKPSEWEWNAARSHYDLEWLPEGPPEDFFQNAVVPATPPGSAVDVLSVNPGRFAAAPERPHTEAVDMEDGSDRLFAGSVDRGEGVDSAPPLGPAIQGVAQGARGDRSKTMDIDDVAHRPDPADEGPVIENPATQEIDAQPGHRGYRESIPGHSGQLHDPEDEDGLFVADRSGRPPTVVGSEFNLEVYDYPIVGQLEPPNEPEAREKSPKQEENMYVGPPPGSPERKPREDEGTNGQGGVDDLESSFDWIEEQSLSEKRPSSSGKRPSHSEKHPSKKRPAYSGKRPLSYSGKRLPSRGFKSLPSQAALKHPPKHGFKRPPSGFFGPSTGEDEDASMSGSDENSESGHGKREFDGGNGQGNDFGDEVRETIEDVERSYQGDLEDQRKATEDTVDDGIGSVGGSNAWSEWDGFSPSPEDKPGAIATSSAQSEQADNQESGHADKNPPGPGAKKRHGEELSPGREKKARCASD